jgi:hypothetical protein
VITGAEQQLRTYRRLPGARMQLIGQMVQTAVLARVVLVEYLAHIQFDLTDDRALRL